MKEHNEPNYPTLEQLKKGTKLFACSALIASMVLCSACGDDEKETTTELVLDGETETYVLDGETSTSATSETTEYILEGEEAVETSDEVVLAGDVEIIEDLSP